MDTKQANATIERLINELDVAELKWDDANQKAWEAKTPAESLEAAQMKSSTQKDHLQAQATLANQIRIFWKAGYQLCRQ